MIGTAVAEDPGDHNLGYEFEAGTNPPEEPTYDGNVASVVFRYEDIFLEIPKKEGNNESTQIVHIPPPPQQG
jgi:hypothetical protein